MEGEEDPPPPKFRYAEVKWRDDVTGVTWKYEETHSSRVMGCAKVESSEVSKPQSSEVLEHWSLEFHNEY